MTPSGKFHVMAESSACERPTRLIFSRQNEYGAVVDHLRRVATVVPSAHLGWLGTDPNYKFELRRKAVDGPAQSSRSSNLKRITEDQVTTAELAKRNVNHFTFANLCFS